MSITTETALREECPKHWRSPGTPCVDPLPRACIVRLAIASARLAGAESMRARAKAVCEKHREDQHAILAGLPGSPLPTGWRREETPEWIEHAGEIQGATKVQLAIEALPLEAP